jgi:phage shock protein C
MERKLERNQQNKMIAGVASGLADYLLIDVTLVRIIFILLAVFGFSGLLIYIILWIAVPEKPFFETFTNFDTDYKVQEDNSRMYVPPLQSTKSNSDSGRLIAGLVLISIGAWFLLAEFNIIPHWVSIFKLWPMILIALGLVILFRTEKKKTFDNLNDKSPITGEDVKTQTEETDKRDEQPLA